MDIVKELDPLFAVADDERTLLKWLKDSVTHRKQIDNDYFRTCKNNLSAYLGNYHKRGGYQSDSLERMPMPKTTKYFVNYLYEFTENLVSKMTRLKPAIDVLPANENFEDKNSAKIVDLLIKHLFYINDVDFLKQKVDRHKYIFGEALCMVKWDKNKGDYTPEYSRIKQAGMDKKLPADLPIDKIKTGDLAFELLFPWHVLFESKPSYEETSNVIIEELKHKKDILFLYPDADVDSIKDGSSIFFDVETAQERRLEKHVNLYTLYAKADEHFISGRKIIFTFNEILYDSKKDPENKGLGYSHGDFPFERVTDMDVPGRLRGRSRYQQALVIQNAHNNMSQSFIKNEFLVGAPKWMVPRGAAKPEQLSNGRVVVQYQGQVAPHLVQMNPTGPASFAFRDSMQRELGQVMQVNELSRGEPPKGVIAAVAMQFIAEQDDERSSSDIAKSNQFIVNLAKKAVSVCGDYYKSSDGRMLRVLGKENKYLIRFFDAANLNKDYDIRIKLGSSTPDSKAAKIARVFQTMQYNPGLFDGERWSELMEFGDTEKMQTLVSVAIQAAESEGEDLLEGNPVEEPKEWEDIIMHLRVHYKKVQARSFKEDVPKDRMAAFIQHIKITEMLAEEKAAKNPLFASKLAQLELYPMFWTIASVPPSAEQQAAMAAGQLKHSGNTGAQIPASEPGPMPGQPVPNPQAQ